MHTLRRVAHTSRRNIATVHSVANRCVHDAKVLLREGFPCTRRDEL